MDKKEVLRKLKSYDPSGDTFKLDLILDKLFGINHIDINSENESLYPDLSTQALSTSYKDYLKILADISSAEKLVDVGAGFCRGSFLARYLSLSPCIGLEASLERYLIASRSYQLLWSESCTIKNVDLEFSKLPMENNYFFYFPKGKVFYKCLLEILSYYSTINGSIQLYIIESHGDMIPFLKACKPLWDYSILGLTSTPRLDNQIYKFEIKNKLQKHYDYNQNLVLWFLEHFDKDVYLVYSYFHLTQDKEVKTIVLLVDLDLIYYQDEWCLQNIYSNRIYQSKEFTLVSVERADSLSAEIKNHLADQRFKKDRVLIEPEFVIEKGIF